MECCPREAVIGRQNSRERMRQVSPRRKGKKVKASQESHFSLRRSPELPPCFFPDPLASALFSVLYLFPAGLAMSASGSLGLAAYLDSLF